jgi:HEPN domain-containing protein
MSREAHVRFWESPRVRFPRATRQIRMGQYFFGDVANEGILLYAGEKLDFAKPKALNDGERLALGEHNFGYWFDSASGFFRGCRYFIGQGLLNHAAFLLHQAAERYFHAASLVLTGYKDRTHDLEKLAQKAAEQHPRLVEALPKTELEDERLFTLLRKAYIEARYNKAYRITLDDLSALQGRVLELARRVREASLEKLFSFCGPDAVSASLPVPPALDEPAPAVSPEWAREYGETQRQEGLREGEARGKAEGLRAAVLDLCEAFGLEPTGAQRAQLEAMGVNELEALRAALKQHKRWPT